MADSVATFASSCVVALPIERNCATHVTDNATTSATSNATQDRVALAIRVLERNKRNRQRNLSATSQLQPPATSATVEIANATQRARRLWNGATSTAQGESRKAANDCAAREPVACAECQHFQRNVTGFGAGIGSCQVNAWRLGQLPLYPHAKRTCIQFKNNEASL